MGALPQEGLPTLNKCHTALCACRSEGILYNASITAKVATANNSAEDQQSMVGNFAGVDHKQKRKTREEKLLN